MRVLKNDFIIAHDVNLHTFTHHTHTRIKIVLTRTLVNENDK